MKILGLNLFHGDASACLFIDDQLVAAAEEERFNRVKHSAGIPINSIKFCLQYKNITIDQIDHIAINRDPKKRFFYKILFSFKKLFKFRFLNDRIKNISKIASVKDVLQNNFEKKIKIIKFINKDDQLSKIAKLISENKVIGFFNERMEFGPRALGNRSILANPGDKNIKEILNLKIKRRESFRPFAPSILNKHVKYWFEVDDRVPFMSKVYNVREDKNL